MLISVNRIHQSHNTIAQCRHSHQIILALISAHEAETIPLLYQYKSKPTQSVTRSREPVILKENEMSRQRLLECEGLTYN